MSSVSFILTSSDSPSSSRPPRPSRIFEATTKPVSQEQAIWATASGVVQLLQDQTEEAVEAVSRLFEDIGFLDHVVRFEFSSSPDASRILIESQYI